MGDWLLAGRHRLVNSEHLLLWEYQYLHSSSNNNGSQIFVEGRLQTRKWQTKEGQDRYTTEVVAATMQMLGSKDSASGGSGSTSDFEQQKSQSSNEPTKAPTPAV